MYIDARLARIHYYDRTSTRPCVHGVPDIRRTFTPMACGRSSDMACTDIFPGQYLWSSRAGFRAWKLLSYSWASSPWWGCYLLGYGLSPELPGSAPIPGICCCSVLVCCCPILVSCRKSPIHSHLWCLLK